MSYASRKGYMGEAVPRDYLSDRLGVQLRRPRTTSRTATDTGDLDGLPMVLSCKAHERMRLAEWVDELEAMVGRSPWETGVVVHKRPGRATGAGYYVTTSLGLLVPLVAAYRCLNAQAIHR
jgi:hypothetical protein